MTNISKTEEIFNPEKWGLPLEAMEKIGIRFDETWERFKDLLTTKTRDTSEYGKMYLRGLLTMETKRNYRTIEKKLETRMEMDKNCNTSCQIHLGMEMKFLDAFKRR